MPWGDLGGWHGLIIIAVILLLFGASRLPALSKGLGQSIRIFRKEMSSNSDEKINTEPADNTAATTTTKTEIPASSDTKTHND